MAAALGLVIAGKSAFGLLRIVLSGGAVQGLVSGAVDILAPERAVRFWRRYNGHRPRWRRAVFTPVDPNAARSMGIGSLIVAAACVLLLSGIVR